MVKPGQPTGVAQLYDINSLHKWPKMTLAVTSAVTFSLTLRKHYFCLLYLKKNPDKIWPVGVAASVWEADLHCLSVCCGLQSSLLWPTKDTESMLPMMCTSHLHMQCKFGHLNWQIPIAEIGLYHRREWIFYLSYHWYFCRLKWLSFKNFCATRSVLLSPAGA